MADSRRFGGRWVLLTIALWLPTAVFFLLGILRSFEARRQAEMQCRLTLLRYDAERLRASASMIPRLNHVWRHIRTTIPTNMPGAASSTPAAWRETIRRSLDNAGLPPARFYLLAPPGEGKPGAVDPGDADGPAFQGLLERFLRRDQPAMRDSPAVFSSQPLLSPIAQFAKVTRENWLYELSMPTRTVWLSWGRLPSPFKSHAYLLVVRGEEIRRDRLNPLWLEVWRKNLSGAACSFLDILPRNAVSETTPEQWSWSDRADISLGFAREDLRISLSTPFSTEGLLWLGLALIAWIALSFAWLAGSLAVIRDNVPPWLLGLRGRLAYHAAVSLVLPLFGLLLLGELELAEHTVNLLSDQDRFLAGSLERIEQAYSRNVVRTQDRVVAALRRMPPILNASEAHLWGFELLERKLGASRVMIIASDGTHLLPLHPLQKKPYFLISRLPLAEKYRFFRRVYDNDYIPGLYYRRMLTLVPRSGDRLSVGELQEFLVRPSIHDDPGARDQAMMKAMSAMARSICRQANELAGLQPAQGGEPKFAEMGTLDMFASLSGVEAEQLIREIFSALGRLMTYNPGSEIIQNLGWLARDQEGRAQIFVLAHWREEDLSLPVSLRLIHRVRRAPRDSGLFIISSTMEGLDLCSTRWLRGFRTVASGLAGTGAAGRFAAPLPGGDTHLFLVQRSRTMPHLTVARSISTRKLVDKLGQMRNRLFLTVLLCLCILCWFARFLHRFLVLPADDIERAVTVLSSPGKSFPSIRDPVGEFLQLARLFIRTVENLRELELAKAVQDTLLPSAPLVQGNWYFHGESRMMEQVGGDYFDFFPIPRHPDPHDAGSGPLAPGWRSPGGPDRNDTGGGRLLVALGDVSGHGLSSAIIVAMAQGALKTMLQQGIDEPKTLLETFGRLLFRHLHRTKTMSLQIFRFDLATGAWSYSNAGQTPPVLVRPDGSTETIEMGAFPAGAREKTKYNLREGTLQPGERLVLYSDGTIEAPGTDGQPVGYPRFAEMASKAVLPGWNNACRRFFADLSRVAKPGGQEDDITFVVIERQGGDPDQKPAPSPPMPRPTP